MLISGLACTSKVCLPPFEKKLNIEFDYGMADSWKEITLNKAAVAAPAEQLRYSIWGAMLLALAAGMVLNLMPCVWPVLPLIVMRIVEQSKQSKTMSITMGIAFCLGILLFFACLCGANIILHIFYGTVLQWGDQLRNPVVLTILTLILIVMALFMFGVFTIGLPASISGKSSTGKGLAGSVGMGFLAAILSTPCSFGILSAAFAWAQTQPTVIATLTIMTIGVGMALPYAVLTSMPGLLKRLPRTGRWMELFKQTIGFVLLVIAVKLIGSLPQSHRIDVLYFSVALAFGVWMWGSWVGYNSRFSHKLIVRTIAVIMVIAAGWLLLPAPAGELIQWQSYNTEVIDAAKVKQRPVLIKFTADWCFNCAVAEKVVYEREDIAKLIENKGVLAIKADTTLSDYPATAALKNVYDEPGVPVSVLLVPGREEPIKWHGISFGTELKAQLEKFPDRKF